MAFVDAIANSFLSQLTTRAPPYVIVGTVLMPLIKLTHALCVDTWTTSVEPTNF